ncbi:MAG TPA: helix-turn-helix domain-containing protein, partial [Polyangiaceae bacterium]
ASWLSRPPSRRQPAPISPTARGEARSEREIIEAALASCRGRVAGRSGAAASLGVPPSTLDNRIKALRIDKKQYKFR